MTGSRISLHQGAQDRQWSLPVITHEEASLRWRAMAGDRDVFERVQLQDVMGLVYRPTFGEFLAANEGVRFNVIEGEICP